MIRTEFGWWLETDETAEALDVDEGWVVEAAAGGWLPAIMIGGRWLVPEGVIDEARRSLAATGGL